MFRSIINGGKKRFEMFMAIVMLASQVLFPLVSTQAVYAQDAGDIEPPAVTTIELRGAVLSLGEPYVNDDFVLQLNGMDYSHSEEITVDPGVEYEVTGVSLPGYELSHYTCNVNLMAVDVEPIIPAEGDSVVCTVFLLALDGVDDSYLEGFVYDDQNENGVRYFADEPGKALVEVRLFDQAWNLLDTTATESDGFYSFDAIDGGIYRLCMVPSTGNIGTGPGLGVQTMNHSGISILGVASGVANSSPTVAGESPFCWTATLYSHQTISFLSFGETDDVADVNVEVFHDEDANGLESPGEPQLEDWTVRIYDSSWGLVDSAVTTGGGALFSTLEYGQYYICEVLESGWSLTSPSSAEGVANGSGSFDEAGRCISAELSGASSYDFSFGNAQYGSIDVVKMEDNNGNSELEIGDVEVGGFVFRLYDTAWSVLDEAIAGSGVEFNELNPGDYYICEVASEGWVQTTPAALSPQSISNESSSSDENQVCRAVNIESLGDHVEAVFGNYELGTVEINIFVDDNANGIKDATEEALAPTLVRHYDSVGVFVDEMNSDASFDDLAPGIHYFCEVVTGQWVLSPSDILDMIYNESPGYMDEHDQCVLVEVSGSGFSEVVSLGNFELATISGVKYLDLSGPSDEPMNGWAIQVYDSEWEGVSASVTGDSASNAGVVSEGQYRFYAMPGQYNVCEVLQDGWAQLGPKIGSESNGATAVANESEVAGEGASCWSLEITESGQTFTSLSFGNTDLATITIVKEIVNDEGGLITDPSAFEYTINGDVQDDWGVALDIPVGTVLIEEVDPGSLGYEMTGMICVVEGTDLQLNDGAYLNLEVGESYECTITNDDRTTTLNLRKTTPVPSGEDFEFSVFGNAGTDDEFVITDEIVLDTTYATVRPFETTINVTPGSVKIVETELDGWANGYFVTCTSSSSPSVDDYVYGNNEITIDVELGDSVECVFENIEDVDITVTKFNDVDQDGFFDQSESEMEEALDGWEINLYRLNEVARVRSLSEGPDLGVELLDTITTSDGSALFAGVGHEYDTAFAISENPQEGWSLSNIYCSYGDYYGSDSSRSSEHMDGGMSLEDIYVIGSELYDDVECFIGNYRDAELTLTKTNDRPEPTANNDTITYTMVVSVPEDAGCVFGSARPITSAEHDRYKGGLHCDSDGPDDQYYYTESITDSEEPYYTAEVEKVTVTDLPPEGFEYVAGSWTANSSVRGDLKAAGITPEPGYASPGSWDLTNAVSNFLTPGEVIVLTYQALVTSQPTFGDHPDSVFARGVNRSNGDVYSNAHIASTPFVGSSVTLADEIEITEQAVVLGVSELANTGSSAFIAPLVGSAIAAVALLPALLERKKGRHLMRGLMRMVKSGGVTTLLLAIIFSTMSAVPAQAMSFERWEVKMFTPANPNSDGEFNLNYQVISVDKNDTFVIEALQNGVVIDSETITTPYGDSGSFEVAIPSPGDYTFQIQAKSSVNGDTKLSHEAAVSYDITSPEAPVIGVKSQAGNTATITFMLPADSDAKTVVIYASNSTSFIAGSATKVGEIEATPGVEQEFVYEAPNSETVYFAVQAVDASGNSSDVAAEQLVTVTDGTSSSGASTTATGVDGEALSSGGDTSDIDSNTNEDGEVLADEDKDEDKSEDSSGSSTVIWVLVGIGASAGLYYLYQSRANKD